MFLSVSTSYALLWHSDYQITIYTHSITLNADYNLKISLLLLIFHVNSLIAKWPFLIINKSVNQRFIQSQDHLLLLSHQLIWYIIHNINLNTYIIVAYRLGRTNSPRPILVRIATADLKMEVLGRRNIPKDRIAWSSMKM